MFRGCTPHKRKTPLIHLGLHSSPSKDGRILGPVPIRVERVVLLRMTGESLKSGVVSYFSISMSFIGGYA